jgi:DNA-binding IclR family transcriptional regulator
MPTDTLTEVPPAGVVSSASKALALLEAVATARRGVIGVSELAIAAQMSKSTAHRLVKELEEHGFVGRSGSKYRAGNGLFRLLEAARWSEYGELRDAAADTLSWLFDECASTVHLAVLEDAEVLYLEKITGPGGCRVPSRVGARLPASCTALGKAMLAFSEPAVVVSLLQRPLPRVTPYSISVPRLLVDDLARARRQGVAREQEEASFGFACLAAPVLVGGQPIAAVSMSHPVSSPFNECDEGLVRRAAARIAHLVRTSP